MQGLFCKDPARKISTMSLGKDLQSSKHLTVYWDHQTALSAIRPEQQSPKLLPHISDLRTQVQM